MNIFKCVFLYRVTRGEFFRFSEAKSFSPPDRQILPVWAGKPLRLSPFFDGKVQAIEIGFAEASLGHLQETCSSSSLR